MLSQPTDVVVTFSWETLADAVARGMHRPPDRLVTGLAATDRVGRVLVCNAPRAPWARSRLLPRRDSAAIPHGISVVQPSAWTSRPPSGPRSADLWGRVVDRQLRHATHRRALRVPLIITFNPILAAFGQFAWAKDVVYYARDDWASYPPHERLWPLYLESYARIQEAGRKVCAVSSEVLRRVGGAGLVLANGLEADEWVGAGPARARGRRRLVYAGVVDDRLDVEVLHEIAASLPAVDIVLAGPVLDAQHVASLGRRGNVDVRGSLDRSSLIHLLRTSHVGLVPHRETALTAAMSPLKLYEYLAAGCPVVATDLEPMRGISPHVALCRTPQQHVEAVRRQLEAGPINEADRLQFVQTNAWSGRHARLLDWALAPAST